jgi:hypothetical protein
MFMRGRFSAADNTVYTSIMAQSMRYDRLPYAPLVDDFAALYYGIDRLQLAHIG